LARSLIDGGFSSEQISIQPGAIDRSIFHPPLLPGSHDSYFLFSGDCKPRKNPEFIEWLILNFPEIDFVIHGRGWNDFKNGSFNSFTNLKIYDFDFSKQATFLRNALALIIVSSNEGGPVSLLESLACGTPVLSTNNGFAPDFIDSNNGLIVRLNQSTDEWFRYFEIAKKLKENVGRTDLLNRPLTWNKLGSELYE
jgi:glycosyltransferase involved in cell wall biosynthesis